MQYTGLKDVYKMDIYEGDIIKVIVMSNMFGLFFRIGLVVFKNGGFYIEYNKPFNYDEKMELLLNDLNKTFHEGTYYYAPPYGGVIGNIYENPELL